MESSHLAVLPFKERPMSTTSTQQPAANSENAAVQHLASENKLLKEMLFGRHGILSGVDTLEKNLATAVRGKHEDAPFPLDEQEARIYHRASAWAYQHSLEMISSECIRELGVKLGCIAQDTPGQADAEAEAAAAPAQ